VIFTVDMGFPTMTPPPADNFAARVFLGPALRAQPDRRLVDLVRDGYDAAFEEIVRRYRRPLDRFAAAIVGGRSEDVTQDAFSKALLALRGSEAEIELRPWLYRIVRNTALNDLRDNPAMTEELSETIAGARSAAAEVEAREELTDLMERLRALPEPQRAALVMRELEGLSHEEIAAALGVSGGAARQAIYRARATLRNGLGLLLPLPLLRALAEGGGEAAAAGAGAAGGAFLGGTAAKVGVATVLVAGAAGAGVAVEQRGGNDDRGPEAAQAAPLTPGAQQSATSGGSGSAGGGNGSSGGSSGEGGSSGRDDERRGEDRRDDRADRKDDRTDSREDRRDDREDRREDRIDDREDEADDDRGGSSGSSGSGSSRSGSSGSSGSGSSGSGDGGGGLEDNSGSGSSSSGSGSSGSGSDDDQVEIEPPEEPVLEEPELDDDSSGSGSGD
jgi:RNA polymerase sigma factor (sigma-70 family)